MKKAALIGCGGRGRAHAEAFPKDAGAVLAAAADLRLEAAEALAAEFAPDARAYSDHQDMLASERPDIVAVSLWTPLHLPVLIDCIDAGVKAVMMEKPMAPTWHECREMKDLAARSGIILAFSHQRRYAKGNLLVRRLVSEGRLGRIIALHLFSPPNMLDCGTHTLDQAMSFMDESPVKWVLGAGDVSKELRWFDVDAECMACAQLVFENGARATIQCGGPDMDIWGGVRLLGEKGLIDVYWDGEISRCVLFDEPGFALPEAEPDSGQQHMEAYWRDVLACMDSGDEPQTSASRALRAAEAIYAYYISLRERRRVELPIPDDTGSPFREMLEAGEVIRR